MTTFSTFLSLKSWFRSGHRLRVWVMAWQNTIYSHLPRRKRKWTICSTNAGHLTGPSTPSLPDCIAQCVRGTLSHRQGARRHAPAFHTKPTSGTWGNVCEAFVLVWCRFSYFKNWHAIVNCVSGFGCSGTGIHGVAPHWINQIRHILCDVTSVCPLLCVSVVHMK